MVDYGKGYLDKVQLAKLANFAHQAEIPIFMDTKKILGNWSKKVHYVKINEPEYQAQIRENIHPHLYCKDLIVTCGANGSVCATRSLVAKGYKVDDAYVVGSGDTFMSVFSIGILEGKNILESMNWANLASSIAVSKPGVATVTKQEIIDMAEKRSVKL